VAERVRFIPGATPGTPPMPLGAIAGAAGICGAGAESGRQQEEKGMCRERGGGREWEEIEVQRAGACLI